MKTKTITIIDERLDCDLSPFILSGIMTFMSLNAIYSSLREDAGIFILSLIVFFIAGIIFGAGLSTIKKIEVKRKVKVEI